MDPIWRSMLWQQFGAAIDTLGDAIQACPEEFWRARLWREGPEASAFSEFWNVAHHTLFWLDLYLSGSVEGFAPPTPFSLEELDPAGRMPETPYTKEQIKVYLEHCRRKCRATIEALTDESIRQICTFRWGQVPFVELLLYNMRHVQEHAAQLNLILGQQLGSAPGWVTSAREAFR